MATPEERNPRVPPVHVNDLGDQHVVERSARGGWRWWWIWPVIIALVLWWAGWGWGSTGGWWFGRSHTQNSAIPAPPGSSTTETLANAGAQQPVTPGAGAPQRGSGPGVQILDAQNKQPFIGKHFDAKDVAVQHKVSDRAIWIETANSEPMLAVVSSPADRSNNSVSQGQLVNAVGTVEKAPPAAQAKSQWSLSDQDAQQLEHEGAYIQVSQLTVPPPQ